MNFLCKLKKESNKLNLSSKPPLSKSTTNKLSIYSVTSTRKDKNKWKLGKILSPFGKKKMDQWVSVESTKPESPPLIKCLTSSIEGPYIDLRLQLSWTILPLDLMASLPYFYNSIPSKTKMKMALSQQNFILLTWQDLKGQKKQELPVWPWNKE